MRVVCVYQRSVFSGSKRRYALPHLGHRCTCSDMTLREREQERERERERERESERVRESERERERDSARERE